MKNPRPNGCRWEATVRGRIRFLAVILSLTLGLPAAKAFRLQVLDRDVLSEVATRQSSTVERIEPRRGPILDRTGQPLAISVPVPSIYALRQEVADKAAAAGKLAQALDMKRAVLYERLARGSGFVWLERQVSPEKASRVRALELEGIYIREESRRYYPNLQLAGAVLGFVGADGGLEGLENSLEDHLRGGPTTRVLDRDASGKAIVSAGYEIETPLTGSTVQLTLDRTIQFYTEEAVESGCGQAGARNCTAIVMETATGRILAMSSYPRFNPNDFTRYGPEAYRNLAVNFTFEPGSTFKIITIAAALDHGVLDEMEILFCENGRFQVADRVINDPMPHAWLTLRGIMKKSSNIGASKVGLELGKEALGQYARAFGFGERTGIMVPGEGRGILRAPRNWTQVDLANISFGQGLAVTPLQMVNAVNAIATGGELMVPYLVERITTPWGQIEHQGAPRVVGRVVSRDVAAKITRMMEAVVEEGGSGTRAAIDGHRVAGKTGTAQKFNRAKGHYSEDSFIASFVGFAPVETPAVTVIVVVDEPAEETYGGVVAAPIWAEIVEKSLQHLRVNPRAPVPDREQPLPAGTRWAGTGGRGPADPDRMPDLTGLTLREALATLTDRDVRVKILGKGVVIGQQPDPGEPVAGEVKLTLEPRAVLG